MSNDLDHFITLSKQLSKGLLLNLHENPFSNNQKSRNILDTNNVETEYQVSLRNQLETKQINIFKKKRFTLDSIIHKDKHESRAFKRKSSVRELIESAK